MAICSKAVTNFKLNDFEEKKSNLLNKFKEKSIAKTLMVILLCKLYHDLSNMIMFTRYKQFKFCETKSFLFKKIYMFIHNIRLL